MAEAVAKVAARNRSAVSLHVPGRIFGHAPFRLNPLSCVVVRVLLGWHRQLAELLNLSLLPKLVLGRCVLGWSFWSRQRENSVSTHGRCSVVVVVAVDSLLQ